MDSLIKFVYDKVCGMFSREKEVNHISFALPFDSICGIRMGNNSFELTTCDDESCKRLIMRVYLKDLRRDKLLFTNDIIIVMRNEDVEKMIEYEVLKQKIKNYESEDLNEVGIERLEICRETIKNCKPIEHLLTEINKFINDLKTLRINLLYGTLESDLHNCSKLNINFMELCCEVFQDLPNIKLDFTECCVCHSMTKSKYKCKHFVCILCDSKLKNNKCPMCRAENGRQLSTDDDCTDSENEDDEGNIGEED